MKNFLEKTLRQNVMIEETEYLNEKIVDRYQLF